MINAQNLIDKFRYALSERWGYIIGKSGQTWTAAAQAKATDDMAVKYGSKWIGRRVADCSGLFVWAFKELGGSIYHGSNTIWKKYCSSQGKLPADIKPGTAVFKLRNGNDYYHIGLYVGDDTVIEAKGTRYGVVTSKLSTWHYWGWLNYVSDEAQPTTEPPPGPVFYIVTAPSGKTVNMRRSASKNSPIVVRVPIGETVQSDSVQDGWARIYWNGKAGYMMTEFLRGC